MTSLPFPQSLYDQCPLGFCTIANGVVRHANAIFKDLFDFTSTPVPLSSSDQKQRTDSTSLAALLPAVQEEITDKAAWRYWSITKRDGTAVELILKVQRQSDGSIHVYAIRLDEIRAAMPENERIAALEKRLGEADAKIRQANETKNEFISHMSHEIRTPLNGIIGIASLFNRSTLSAEHAWYVDMILRSSGTLLALVNDVLDFSRLDAGRREPSPAPFDLHECLLNLCAGPAIQADRKGLEFSCGIDPSLPRTLIGDITFLRQILGNLLDNAVKFTQKGVVELLCELRDREGELIHLHFAVKDTGRGISSESLSHIFDRFSQEDGSVNRQYGGTGLGLAIADKLARVLGGRLRVESDKSKGSTFHCTLPFSVSTTHLPECEKPPETRPVLVIGEPEAPNLLQATRWFTHWAIPFHRVHNSAAAASIGRKHRILLFDIPAAQVPNIEFIADLAERLDKTRIAVFLSPSRFTLCQGDSLLAKVTVLPKPVFPDHLRALLTEREITTFHTFPRTDAEQEQDFPPKAGESLGPVVPRHTHHYDAPTPAQTTKSLKVLVVEDNEINQVFIQRTLVQHGHQVGLASNGREACELAESGNYDAVLMDIQMPVMDGLEATRKIREREAREGGRLPILALSAGTSPSERERCTAAGMDSFVAKPVSVGELLRELAAHTQVSSSSPNAVSRPASPPKNKRPPTTKNVLPRSVMIRRFLEN
ncbi:MAG: response regulator [Chitinivibrionales bacterium]|nr:response regulator [Chitinivibrionales bacterium]MBD3357580.1 response regulator [Chitinivibrionales bacterium]